MKPTDDTFNGPDSKDMGDDDSAAAVRQEAVEIYERANGAGGALRKGLQRDGVLRRRLMKHGHTWSHFVEGLEQCSGSLVQKSQFVQFYVRSYADPDFLESEGEPDDVADSIEVWREIARGLKSIPPSERPSAKKASTSVLQDSCPPTGQPEKTDQDMLVIHCPRRAIRCLETLGVASSLTCTVAGIIS